MKEQKLSYQDIYRPKLMFWFFFVLVYLYFPLSTEKLYVLFYNKIVFIEKDLKIFYNIFSTLVI